jgi:Putative DNA-binding domain
MRRRGAATRGDAGPLELFTDGGPMNAQLRTDLAQGPTLGVQGGCTLNVHGGSVSRRYVDRVPRHESLYDVPASDVTYELLEGFVNDALEANLLTESMTLELKLKRSSTNVAEAVAALANSDGGIVLVGVDDNGSDIRERLVGVPEEEHDRLVDHLGSLLDPIPEVIPVAVPNKNALIIVLRVRAEDYLHPVLVGGKVVYRVPGATVRADRQRVVDLLHRDERQVPTGMRLPAMPRLADPAHMPLWTNDNDPIESVVRVIGGLVLPSRAIDRPWMPTAARDAIVESLNESVIPAGVWQMGEEEVAVEGLWQVRDRRSDFVALHAPTPDQPLIVQSAVRVEAGAYVSLEGRDLTCLIGLRRRSTGGHVVPLGLDEVYAAVLAGMVAVRDVCRRVSISINAAAPVQIKPWQGWLQAEHYKIPHVVDIPFGRDAAIYPLGSMFPPSSTRTAADDDLDRLARDWLTVMLLDLGARDFEDWLVAR